MAMPLPLPFPTYTTEDLRAFPDDGCRYELLNGMLLVTPAPAQAHQAVLFRLCTTVGQYLGENGAGVAASPGEIEIAPRTLLDPDLLVYPACFAPATPWTGISDWWLAVEVSGRGSRRYDRDFKRNAYLALGVREVWLVDLDEKCVLVSREGAPRDVRHAERLSWHPSEMAEPLVIDVARLFRGVP
jgi:Uma2 family endonuclease